MREISTTDLFIHLLSYSRTHILDPSRHTCSKVSHWACSHYLTSAPIGAWKYNFTPFNEIMTKRPTNGPTDQANPPSDGHEG